MTGSRNETCSLYEWYRVACLFPWPFLFIPLLVVLRTDPRVASFLPSFLPTFMLMKTTLPIFLPLHFDSNSIPDALSSRTVRVSLQRETFFSDPEDLSPFDSLINNVLNSSLQGSLNPVSRYSRVETLHCSFDIVPSLVAFSSKPDLDNCNVIVQTRI